MELNVRFREEKINSRLNYPLNKMTSLGIGGPADYYVEPKNISEIETIVNLANEYKLPYVVLGNGTNVLISDKGYKGIVINMKNFLGITIKGDLVSALVGENLDRLINRAIEHNLKGLEELGGIPGTVGGAVKGNAGSNGKAISDYFFYADYIAQDGKIRRMSNYGDNFSYRQSPFSDTDILLNCSFRLAPCKDTAKAMQKKETFKTERKLKGQYAFPSAGCFFKNPESGVSAGKLIDDAGLKGFKMGNAIVSPYHASFLINPTKKASAKEIYDLSLYIIDKVKERFGITLEREVRLIGEF